METLPTQTNEIFEILSKGGFICANSIDSRTRLLFDITENNFEPLNEFYGKINFILEQGDNYFYFSKKETRASLEDKIERAFKWIDIVDFFKTFDSAFGPGYRFSPSAVVEQCKIDSNLKQKLDGLKKYPEGKSEKLLDRVRKLAELLTGKFLAEQENPLEESYKVLASFSYIERLIMSINILDEEKDEIP